MNAMDEALQLDLKPEDEGQSKSKKISTTIATLNVTMATMGVGAFILVEAAMDAGVFMAIVANALIAYSNYEGTALISTCLVAWNAKYPDDQISSFEKFGFCAWGKLGATAASFANNALYMGVLSVYVICVGNYFWIMAGLAKYNIHQATVRLFFLPLYLVWPMLKDLSALSYLSHVGFAASILIPASILFQAFADIGRSDDWEVDPQFPLMNVWPENGLMVLGNAVACVYAGWGYVGIMPSQAREMEKPQDLPLVAMTTSIIVFSLYAAVIYFGYLAHGNWVCYDYPVNLRNFPASLEEAKPEMLGNRGETCGQNWTGEQSKLWYMLGTVCVIFQNLIGYPIILMTPISALQEIQCVKSCAPAGSWRNCLMRAGLVSVTVIIGYLMPNLSTAVGLFASICTPLITFVLPCFFAQAMRRKLDIPEPSLPKKLLHLVLLALAFFTGVFGISANIIRMF